jgi:hypothetical protein
MSPTKEHEAVLRRKCRNGTLYRNDAKLASWLGVPIFDVPAVLDSLIAADVLRLKGNSSKGTERYVLGFPSWLSADARRLYRVMLSKTTASDIVNTWSVRELAALAGQSPEQARAAYRELEQAALVTEETFDDKRFPVILRRFEGEL